MIQHLSLKHGWFYHYRVHKDKTKNLCPPTLKGYLERMLVRGECPDEPFHNGPRSSALKFPVDANITQIDHPIIQLAAAGLANPRYKTAHSNVQTFMLQHDAHSVAVEVPIWWHAKEMGAHAQHFDEEGPLSGHIDVLRLEDDGNVWVWDYKPNAHREKFAHTQTYFYAQMLAARSSIPLEKMRCGWFDEKRAYVFDPNKVR